MVSNYLYFGVVWVLLVVLIMGFNFMVFWFFLVCFYYSGFKKKYLQVYIRMNFQER